LFCRYSPVESGKTPECPSPGPQRGEKRARRGKGAGGSQKWWKNGLMGLDFNTKC